MKLVTFQTKEAFAILKNKGILFTNASFINTQKYGIPYDWIVCQMKKKKILPENQEQYPLWAWAKCGSFIAPRKRKNINRTTQNLIKITFDKPENDVLLSDYMAYSFILSGHIVPKTKTEYQHFLNKVQAEGISLEDLKGYIRHEPSISQVARRFFEIKKTWPRIFDLKSNVQQACVWNIKLSEVQKIEILDDPNYIYGTMNAKRRDGSRPDWKKAYLKFLK